MVEDDACIVHNSNGEKRTLLERYDIPVEHLSFEYISECTNGKTLEHILAILLSGEEGFYPDLTKHAEERLAVIKPTSVLLRKIEPVLKREMLDPCEYKKIDNDINDWTSEMQMKERDLEEGKTVSSNPVPLPDIRKFMSDTVKENVVKNSRNDTSKSKRISSCDYAAWDKYDVDTELNKIDIRNEQQRNKARKFQQKQKEMTSEITTVTETTISLIFQLFETNHVISLYQAKHLKMENVILLASLTGTELDVMAEQEREKGNEAFRSKDYVEALEHYNTCIKMNSSLLAYNNRAMTYIKLQQYQNALNDCNVVLNVEHNNIKALLRRATALEHLENSPQALTDFEAVLKLEPTNAVAISGVKRLRKPCESRKVRMAIEEQTEDQSKTFKCDSAKESLTCSSQFSSRMTSGSNICYCDRAPGPSQNLRPRPHIKSKDCLGNEDKQANNNSNKGATVPNIDSSIISKKSVFDKSDILPEKEDNLTTKQKSIFSCTMPTKRPSTVVLEELPSEPSKKDSANVKTKPKEATPKGNSSSKKAKSKSKSSNIEREMFVVKPFQVGEIRIADKYIKKTSKEEYPPKNNSNIESGYEFIRIWQSIRNDNNLEAHAQLLRTINMDRLNIVLGNELDGNMFSTILQCLERHFCTSNDVHFVRSFLKSLCQLKRFLIVNMFMSAEDKQVLKNIFNFLEEQGVSDVLSLRQIFCI